MQLVDLQKNYSETLFFKAQFCTLIVLSYVTIRLMAFRYSFSILSLIFRDSQVCQLVVGMSHALVCNS